MQSLSSHAQVFFHSYCPDNYESRFGKLAAYTGDLCLKPFRNLFKGDVLSITRGEEGLTKVTHREIEDNTTFEKNSKKTALNISLLIPGLICGMIMKASSYLSASVRENHQLAVKHYTRRERTIVDGHLGSKNFIDGILNEIKNNNAAFNQKTSTLTIQTKTKISPLILARIIHELEPQKIILVGTKLQEKQFANLREMLETTEHRTNAPRNMTCEAEDIYQDAFIEGERISHPNGREAREKIFIKQWRALSLEAAQVDTPPRKSLFSGQRHIRIYVVD